MQGGLFDEIYAELGDAFTPQAAAHVFGALVAAEPRIRVVTGAWVTAVTTVTSRASHG